MNHEIGPTPQTAGYEDENEARRWEFDSWPAETWV